MTQGPRVPSELFDCERVNAYLDSYLMDQVPPPERRGMRLHIHGCPACFEKVMARDPLQLFAPLAEQTPSETTWDGFWPAIQAGIQTRRSSRRVWMRAAAVIAVTAAAAAALILAPRFASRPLGPAGPGGPAPAGVTGAPYSADAGPAAGSPMPQTVEQVRSAGSGEVQVYTMTWSREAGAGTAAAPPTAELVLIVDKGLEL